MNITFNSMNSRIRENPFFPRHPRSRFSCLVRDPSDWGFPEHASVRFALPKFKWAGAVLDVFITKIDNRSGKNYITYSLK